MSDHIPNSPSTILSRQLKAVFTARKATLEFERQHAGLDQRDRLGRELFELRNAESMLPAVPGPADGPLLASLAQAAAEDLEQLAAGLYRDMGGAKARERGALLRTVGALLRVSQLGEARARSFQTADEEGHRLDGHDDAMAQAPEAALLSSAMRRFQTLLDREGDWDARDADQLYLRALSSPGRLRLQAASLRTLAKAAAGLALPPAMREAVQPFLSLGLSEATGLAWFEGGFSAEECVDWREAGLKRPEQAHAWHVHGFDPAEAAAWSKAGLLPDESGAYVFCGISSLAEALELRQALGEVEHLLAWRRAGYDGPRVLACLKEGIRTPDQALAQGRLPDEAPVPGELSEAPPQPEPPAPAEAVVPAASPAPEPAPAPASGAWLGWGAWNAVSAPAPADCLALGRGYVDWVAGSEGVALPGQVFSPASLQPDSEWEARLAKQRGARQAPKAGGAWHLYAWPPLGARLIWGACFKGPAAPWADAVDYSASEAWNKRWARKTEEWGEEGAKPPCRVGRLGGQGWWVALAGVGVRFMPGADAPVAFEPDWPTAAWRHGFEDFCLKMEIPLQAPHWRLMPTEPEDREP